MTSILEKIAHYKKEEIALAKRINPLKSLLEISVSETRDFIGALQKKDTPSIIAEIKKASPSKGLLCENFDVIELAETYAAHGASCLSVLTDIHFFQGSPDYLALAKSHCKLPILRKDFIIDEYQIQESRTLGADCILLIVPILDPIQLHDYCQIAQTLDMAVLVESHTEEELEQALKLSTPLMGINNRSLHTFKTDLQTTIALSKNIPEDRIIISESGINTRNDIKVLEAHGIHAFLIGETLMRAKNRAEMLTSLIND